MACPAPFAKIFSFAADPNQMHIHRRPVPSEGRIAIVTDAGRDAVDAVGALDETCCSGRRSRVVLTPRCWRQVGDKKRRRRCQTSLVTGESTKETVKPLRVECRVISGVTVVTMLVCFFHFAREAAGALGARHSLRPLISEGRSYSEKLARVRRDRGGILKIEGRHGEERSNLLLAARTMDCSAEFVHLGEGFESPVRCRSKRPPLADGKWPRQSGRLGLIDTD
jgi:hypothetical protein